jgi:CRP-like cAMP-binding protein
MREFRSALISLAPHRPLSPEKRVAVASTRGNRLLEGIGEEAWQAMHPYLEPVELEPDKTIERRGTPAGYVYFPTSGLCAVFGHAHGQKIELALVGTDELVGTSGVLGRPDAALETVVQLPTSAWRIASSDLAALLDQHADLRVELTTYVDALIRQIAASAVTIGHASVEQRVARWLSLVAERSGLDRIEVTHEAMGRALAVRRAGITVALHELEARGAVKSMRKLVRILDREKLAKLAGPFDPSKT